MAFIPFLPKDKFDSLNVSAQVNALDIFPINYAFTAVAQEVAGLLQHPYPFQTDDNNPTWRITDDHSETIAILAIEPEYRQIIRIETLSGRELEVLQLIVDGYKNPAIAGKLYITEGTVKTHVRNILRKLCASDRTQAAIRALRSGLVS